MKKIFIALLATLSFHAMADITCDVLLTSNSGKSKNIYSETIEKSQVTASGTYDFEAEFVIGSKAYAFSVESTENTASLMLVDLKNESYLVFAENLGYSKPYINCEVKENHFSVSYFVPSSKDVIKMTCSKK